MNRPANRLLWIVGLVLTAAVGGCGKSPGSAASEFLTDYDAGKFADAEKLLSKNSAGQFDQAAQSVGGHDQLIALLEQARAADRSNAISKVDIGITTIIVDKAIVHYKVIDPQGKPSEERQMDLVKEDGKWKVDFERFAPWSRVAGIPRGGNGNGRGAGGGGGGGGGGRGRRGGTGTGGTDGTTQGS